MRGPLGKPQGPPAERRVAVPAGKRDSSPGGSSVVSTIQGQISTSSSSLNDSRVTNITLSTAQRWSILTPTATPGTSSRNTPAPSGTSQTDSMRHVVSSPASGITGTPTPLSGLEILTTTIPNPEAHAIIQNPLRTQPTERNQRQTQWQWQRQAVSTPLSMISGTPSIHQFGHSDMMRLEFATGSHLELYLWNGRLFMSASDLGTVSYAR